MNILLVCFIITLCIVYVWDWVGFPQEITNLLASKITRGKIKYAELKKPFSCSLCMTTWITLIVLGIVNWHYLPMALVYGASTKYILYIYTLIDEFITKLLTYIETLIQS